jgi:hypothetical protein
MPTLIEAKTLESCASLCRELGLAFVELNMNMPDCCVVKFTAVKGRYYSNFKSEDFEV